MSGNRNATLTSTIVEQESGTVCFRAQVKSIEYKELPPLLVATEDAACPMTYIHTLRSLPSDITDPI